MLLDIIRYARMERTRTLRAIHWNSVTLEYTSDANISLYTTTTPVGGRSLIFLRRI